jgi:hypothetical protein
LIQESLSVADKTETKDLERIVVDMTVQPKAVAHPTDARLMHRATVKLVALARHHGVTLGKSYLRVAKRAAIIVVGSVDHPTHSRRLHCASPPQTDRMLQLLTSYDTARRDFLRLPSAREGPCTRLKAHALP